MNRKEEIKIYLKGQKRGLNNTTRSLQCKIYGIMLKEKLIDSLYDAGKYPEPATVNQLANLYFTKGVLLERAQWIKNKIWDLKEELDEIEMEDDIEEQNQPVDKEKSEDEFTKWLLFKSDLNSHAYPPNHLPMLYKIYREGYLNGQDDGYDYGYEDGYIEGQLDAEEEEKKQDMIDVAGKMNIDDNTAKDIEAKLKASPTFVDMFNKVLGYTTYERSYAWFTFGRYIELYGDDKRTEEKEGRVITDGITHTDSGFDYLKNGEIIMRKKDEKKESE